MNAKQSNLYLPSTGPSRPGPSSLIIGGFQQQNRHRYAHPREVPIMPHHAACPRVAVTVHVRLPASDQWCATRLFCGRNPPDGYAICRGNTPFPQAEAPAGPGRQGSRKGAGNFPCNCLEQRVVAVKLDVVGGTWTSSSRIAQAHPALIPGLALRTLGENQATDCQAGKVSEDTAALSSASWSQGGVRISSSYSTVAPGASFSPGRLRKFRPRQSIR